MLTCRSQPGEMLVTVPATFAKSWGRFVESNYNPNFHFAPCVLVDEEENIVVTLENWVSSLHWLCVPTKPIGRYLLFRSSL